MIGSAEKQAVMRARARERNRLHRADPEVRQAEVEAKQRRPQLPLCIACLPSSFTFYLLVSERDE